MAYLAPFISPEKLLLPAFFGLAYPYFLLANIIFLAYWIIRFKKQLAISLLAILLGWNHLMNFMPLHTGSSKKSQSEDAEKTELVLFSYNVRTFDQYKWTKKDDTKEAIFKLINSTSPHILCLQEFYTANKSGFKERNISSSLEDLKYYSIYYGYKSSPNTGTGIATYSKYPIVKTSRIPFNNTSNLAVYTDIKVGNDTIRVFNIHLQSIKFGQKNYSFVDSLSLKNTNKQLEGVKDIGSRLRNAFVQRAEQSRIINRYIASSPYPVIVMGDFNDTPVSYAYRKIRKGLSDSFRKGGKGLGNTYAGDLPSFRIDYIFYSDELEVNSFKRIKSKFSDHYPITANIRWKEDNSETE